MPLPFKIEQSNAGLATITRSILLALSAIFFAWIVWNIWHAVPAADDFCYGAGARERGVLQNVVSEYFNWGGRFSATLLMSLFAGSESLLLRHYYLAPMAILVLNLWAAWAFLRAFGLQSAALSVFFCVMLMATFRMRESLFWLSGGATYGVACALLLALIAQQWKIFSGQVALGLKRTAVIALGSIFLAGLNEVASLAHLVIIGLATLSAVLQQKRNRLLVVVAAVAVMGAVIAFTAPGNFVRAAGSINNSGIVAAFGASLLMVLTKYAAPAILHTLLFVVFIWACQPNRPSGIRQSHLIAFIVCLSLALWAAVFPRAYALHALGPERARTIDFLLLNLIALSSAMLLHDRGSLRSSQPRPVLAAIIHVGAALLVISVIALPKQTVLPIWNEMVESANLRMLIDQRLEQAGQAAGQSLVVTGYTAEQKPITFFNDVKKNPTEWENICFANYFGLRDVQAR